MSAPPAPTWSPPSGSAISSEPNSPSSGRSSSPPAPPAPGSSIAFWSPSQPPQPTARAAPGGGGSGTPAPAPPPGCAACKHKRQKCPPGCVLLPYFPSNEPDKFRNVLRVFGVKNLLRTLREVPRPRWDACVRTLVYESRARLVDPVRGLVGAIEELEGQLVDTAVEIVVLRRRLESYRQAMRQALIVKGIQLQPPNPIHGCDHGRAAAELPRGVTDPDLGVVWQKQGRMTRDDVMQPLQGGAYYGEVWPPAAMAGLTVTPSQFSATHPQIPAMTPPQVFSEMPPQIYATTQPQFLATQPQFSATQPELQLPMMQQQPEMCREPTRGASTAMVCDGFVGNTWANDGERGGPDDF